MCVITLRHDVLVTALLESISQVCILHMQVPVENKRLGVTDFENDIFKNETGILL